MKRIAVIGAGLAGLSCALQLSAKGYQVEVFEASGHAGGRCRSYFDPLLERTIDNGSHLMLGGNRTLKAYLHTIDAAHALTTLPPAFAFFDVGQKRFWQISPTFGGIPPAAIWGTLRLLLAARSTTVADCLGQSRLFASLWHPLCDSVLNTPPEQASAALLGRVLRLIMAGGAKAACPRLAPDGLSTALVDPALHALQKAGVAVHLHARLRALEGTRLHFDDAETECDAVVLALPHRATRRLLPELPELPSHCIVNAHFRLEHLPRFPEGVPFLGIVGGTAHWLFLRNDILSVTVSAADALASHTNEEIAALLWADCRRAVDGLGEDVPPVRILREHHATIAHTPETLRLRPQPGPYRDGIFLAGDWTDTRLPCTIEGALLSGVMAAASFPP